MCLFYLLHCILQFKVRFLSLVGPGKFCDPWVHRTEKPLKAYTRAVDEVKDDHPKCVDCKGPAYNKCHMCGGDYYCHGACFLNFHSRGNKAKHIMVPLSVEEYGGH